MEVPEASYRARSTYSLFQNEQDTHVQCLKKKRRRFLNSFSLVLKPISSSSPLSRPHNENSAAYHQKRATRE